ncbi:signal peptidase I [Nitrosopumilus sp.]|nr:signal peptidase I [Nitrosopumilus sp.]
MAKKSNGIIRDIGIVAVAITIMWIGIQVVFGVEMLKFEDGKLTCDCPFYVVVSGSMIPALEINDIIVIQGHDTFEEVEIGDIIVFDRPSDHNRVIVHRVDSIIGEDPKIVRTLGDNNNGRSIPGTDFPITEEEYIGKVAYIIPQLGYVTQMLQPPTNYIIIAVVIGIMIIKQFTGKKKDVDDLVSKETLEELSDIGKIEADSEYSEDIKKSEITEEKIKDSEKSTKKDSLDKENN